jgi:hypothetical protein
MAKVQVILLGLALAGACAGDGAASENEAGPFAAPEAGAARAQDAATRDGASRGSQPDASADAPPAAEDADASAGESTIDSGPALPDARTADAAHADDALVPSEGGLSQPHSPTATYRAERYIGGLDRITVIKSDVARGYCVQVSLYSPTAAAPGPGLSLPKDWTLASMIAVPSDDGCFPSSDGGVDTRVFGHNPQGRVAWRELGPHGTPCSVDIDLELTFEPRGPIPMRDRLFVEGLAVPCD